MVTVHTISTDNGDDSVNVTVIIAAITVGEKLQRSCSIHDRATSQLFVHNNAVQSQHIHADWNLSSQLRG